MSRSPRINIFAAHPDDCEISMGCYLIKNRSRDICVIYATQGDYLDGTRRPEIFLKNIPHDYLSYKDCSLTNTIELRRDLERYIAPDDINLVHWPDDCHKDHRELSQAVYDVCRGKNIVYYNSVSAQNFSPNLTFDYSIRALKRKIKLLQKAFTLDRPYLKEPFFAPQVWENSYIEKFHVKNSSTRSLKLFL